MKTKTSSKRIALLGSALLALSIFAPAVVEAVPITLSLDNPNQTLASPSSDTILDFTGTVTIDPTFLFNRGKLDLMCKGNTGICLNDQFDPVFLDFLNGGGAGGTGTFTGLMFTATVPAGATPGLYNINVTLPDLSQLFLQVIGPHFELVDARENISVLVTGVPDSGSSILLLGLSLAALCSVNALKRVAA